MLRYCFLLLAVLAIQQQLSATDTTSTRSSILREQRIVRNYIRPSFSFNTFFTRDEPLVPVRRLSQSVNDSLVSYRTSETQFAFITPLYTHTQFGKKDSTDVNTFHLLFTASDVRIRPVFSGLDDQHILSRTGVSLRALYTFRSKFILFYDASPFVVADRYKSEKIAKPRFATTAVFSWLVHPGFSLRAGFTRTFRLGNKHILPTFGVRLGRLDGKVYFTAQYPRFAALVIQPNAKLAISAYTRSYGSLFFISNRDSLYPRGDEILQLGQLGLANGIRIDFRANNNFSCFLSSGFSQNRVFLFSESYNSSISSIELLRPFYRGRTSEPAPFIHARFTVRFGKAKTSAGNYLMYDAFELNNTIDPVDGNNISGNSDITPRSNAQQAQKIQYQDVQDLISDTDLY